ncbi:PREDICTED: UDP-glycosyltransferase 92A1 [Tarenaya hassleriana]|uniref:UDP-glycosyltransferase 92A1 n=1 Tax=Tarenaya hassleriana TaxID=28532 RepID=UPI00053C44A8|nr:PREDICTED: UDP-glycosyltransferase 92A1 [Tarenaya hassleriana]
MPHMSDLKTCPNLKPHPTTESSSSSSPCSSMASEKPTNLNVVMFPFMAQGHIIPFLALALHMEKTKNRDNLFTITLVNTQRNISNLRSSLPPESSIELLEIPFESSDHGLPPDAENFDSLPYPLVIRLLHASVSLKEPFRNLLMNLATEKDSVCVIGDFFMGWVGRVCKELGVFTVTFSASGAFGLGCYRSVWATLPHTKTEDDEFFLEDFPGAGKIHRTQLNFAMLEADGTDDWSVFQQNNMSGWADSDGFMFNTVAELEQTGLSYFRTVLGIPVWAIGPILLSGDKRGKLAFQTEDLKAWLDSKPENSVLYICFGSMNTISQAHMMELAAALEASEKNFIWVVRPPTGFDINGPFNAEEWLPKGFEDRIKRSRRGLVVERWAPQVDILSHRATSAFLSHCGWNSTLEALSHGVPILGWPMAGEQCFNSKFLREEMGVCVEIARGKKCEIKREEIVAKMGLVMEESEVGEGMRKKAKEAKEVIKTAMEEDGCGVKGSSVVGIDEFFSKAMLHNK